MINKYGAALLLVWISLTSYSQSTSTVKASIDSTLVSKETNIIDTLTRRERRLSALERLEKLIHFRHQRPPFILP